MKLDNKTKKAIEKDVDNYCKSLETKDENGVVTGTALTNEPTTLLALYRQTFWLTLPTDEQRLHAKFYFKSKLPYKAWAERMSKTPGALRSAVEDFQEMVDPRYQRKTPKGGTG